MFLNFFRITKKKKIEQQKITIFMYIEVIIHNMNLRSKQLHTFEFE